MKHRSNRFLGCFCFPGKSSEKKFLPEIVKSGSHRRKNKWLQRLRWSSFAVKKLDGKTVPVDVNPPGKSNRNQEIQYLKKASDDQKLAPKFQSPAAGSKQAEMIQVVQSERKLPEKADEKYKTPINIVLDDNTASKKTDTHKNGLFSCRKKGPKVKTVDDPNSPRAKKKSAMTRSKSQPAIFQSVTQPPPKLKKQAAAPMAEPPVKSGGGKEKREKSAAAAAARKYDPVIGMSIIMVVLVVMLLWGKICAILFTSACFFFVSRFGVIMESNFTRKEGLNFEVNSEVYDKKKVVMEGFLARNVQRKVVGFL